MQSWSNRAIEEANLFNPAFCVTLLARSVENFKKKSSSDFPFTLAFVVLPIVLHARTREALPGTTVTSILAWTQDNHGVLVGFASRVRALRDITREALLFGTQSETLVVGDGATLLLGAKRKAPTGKRIDLFTDEARACVDRAAFLGRWFAGAGSTSSIYAALGVRP